MAFVGVNRRGGTKFNWNKNGLKQLIGEAAAQALQKAGLQVRRSTQRGMVGGSTRTGRTWSKRKPQFRMYGIKDGLPVVGAIRQVASLDKVSTWAPKAWLRNDIESDWDHASRSVVVGPSKTPWLNQLHEFGGVEHYWVAASLHYKTYRGVSIPQKFLASGKQGRDASGRFTKRLRGAYVGPVVNRKYGQNAIYIGSRNLRGRGYMEIGLQASLSKIRPCFLNTISKSTFSGGSVGR
jgi:hypothetical protein